MLVDELPMTNCGALTSRLLHPWERMCIIQKSDKQNQAARLASRPRPRTSASLPSGPKTHASLRRNSGSQTHRPRPRQMQRWIATQEIIRNFSATYCGFQESKHIYRVSESVRAKVECLRTVLGLSWTWRDFEWVTPAQVPDACRARSPVRKAPSCSSEST